MVQVQWMKGEKTEITKLNDAQKYRNSWKMCNYAGVSKRMRCDYRMHLWYISCFIQTFDFFRANRRGYTEYCIRKAKHQVGCALKLFGHANSEQSQKCDISSKLIFRKNCPGCILNEMTLTFKWNGFFWFAYHCYWLSKYFNFQSSNKRSECQPWGKSVGNKRFNLVYSDCHTMDVFSVCTPAQTYAMISCMDRHNAI